MKLMSMTQEQQIAALRAELERIRAEQSKAIEKLAEAIGERNDFKAKLATVEADCAAMRDVCQQVFNDHFPTEADTRCRQCYWKLKDALEDGSGQRLLDELAALRKDNQSLRLCVKDDTENEEAARTEARKVLSPLEVDGDSHGVPTVADIVERLVIEVAHLRGMAQHMAACRALLNVPNDEVLHQAIQDLRETAKRRLDWLRQYEAGERMTCPDCGGIVSAPQRHTADCRLGKDVAMEDAE